MRKPSELPRIKNTKTVLRKAYLGKHPVYNLPQPAVHADTESKASVNSHPRALLQAIDDPQIAILSLNDKLKAMQPSRPDPRNFMPPTDHIMIEFVPGPFKSQDEVELTFHPLAPSL